MTNGSKLTADSVAARKWRERRAGRDELGEADLSADLAEQARLVRLRILDTINAARAGHIGGDFSVTDILTTLFEHVLRFDPENPELEGRDRLVLSKGHCSAALYSVLSNVGYFDAAELDSFMAPGSALNGHPNRNKVPGVETNTGPLGHGLPVAVGQAVAARLKGNDARVFVIVGDGELQEGSNWEALMSASHFGLQNLSVIVDRNTLQQGARTEETVGLEPLDKRLRAFGCEVRIVDGHDYLALVDAFEPATGSAPVAVIAKTRKGCGVSFIEDRVEWHHKVPSDEQYDQALAELS